jgi:uncharacterized membrane protein YkvA (DUF1232 family)
VAADQAKPEGQAPPDAFDAQAPLAPSRALVPYAVRLNTVVVKRGFWPKIRKLALHIPFAEDALAMFFCALDPKTPTATKGVLLAALAYFVLPTDAIPDWLPGIGFTDDAAVIAAALAATGRAIQPRHREQAQRALARIAGEPPAVIEAEAS